MHLLSPDFIITVEFGPCVKNCGPTISKCLWQFDVFCERVKIFLKKVQLSTETHLSYS